MELFALVGLSTYCLVSLVVGVRLLLLAQRTRELPELFMGLAFLSGGAIGYPIVVASTRFLESDPALARTLFYLGMPLLSICAALLYRFWQQVYHPRETRAALVFWGVVALLAVGLGMQWATTEPGSIANESPWYHLQLYLQGGAYAINMWANGRFQQALRRRISLGLADPIVANRVFLWAVASSAVVLQYVYTMAVIYSTPAGEHAIGNPGIISALGLIAGVLILLAFFPPAAYRRWISPRGERVSDSAPLQS